MLPPLTPPLPPYTTLFRSHRRTAEAVGAAAVHLGSARTGAGPVDPARPVPDQPTQRRDPPAGLNPALSAVTGLGAGAHPGLRCRADAEWCLMRRGGGSSPAADAPHSRSTTSNSSSPSARERSEEHTSELQSRGHLV